jgi:adenylylsulfate kinase-like enzyme
VITGISGSGKTINAYYTALQLQQNEGFVVNIYYKCIIL